MSASARPSRRRWARRAAWAVGGLLAVAALLVAAVLVVAQTAAGHRLVARVAEDAAGVRLTGIEGSLLSDFGVAEVAVADAAGAWLTAEQVRVAWQPLALLGGSLRIDVVEAAAVTVARPPAEDGSAETAAPAPPRLPLDVDLRRIDLPRVSLGEPVLGVPAVFGIAGAVAGQAPQTVTAQLDMERRDGVAGHLRLRAELRAQERWLDLSLAAVEPPGGLLARLLDLPDLPALRLELAGQGPLADWRGRLQLDLPGLYGATAGLALAGEAAPTLTVEGSGVAARDFEALPWALLNGTTTVQLTAARQADGVVVLRRLRLQGAAWQATTSGQVDPDTLAGRLQADVAVSDAAALAPLAGGVLAEGLRVTLEAEGSPERIAATANADASAVRLDELTAERVQALVRLSGPPSATRLQATVEVGRAAAAGVAAEAIALRFDAGTAALLDPAQPLMVEAQGRVGALAVPGLDPALLAGGVDWQATSEIRLDAGPTMRLGRLAVTTGAGSVGGSGTADLGSGSIAGDLAVTVPDLAALAPALPLPLAGQAAVSISVLAEAFGEVFAARLAGEAEARSDDQVLQALLGGQVGLTARLSGGRDAGLALEALALRTPALTLSAEGSAEPDLSALQAGYSLTLDDLSRLSAPAGVQLQGRLRLDGTAGGTPESLQAAGEATLQDLRAEGLTVPAARLRYDLAGLPAAPRGGISASAETAAGRLTGQTAVALLDGVLALDDIAVGAAAGGEVTGTLRLPLETGVPTGRLEATLPDLRPWLTLAGLDGSGRASASVDLGAAGRAEVEVGDLAVDLDGEAVRVAAATLTADGIDFVTQRFRELRLQVEGAARGELSLEQLSLQARGGPAAAGFELEARGRALRRFALEAAGEAAFDDAAVRIRLVQLQGEALGQAVSLARPLTLAQGPDMLAVEDLDLRFGPAALAGSARLGADAVEVALSLRDLDLARLDGLAPEAGLSGSLQASLQASGLGAAQRGSLRLAARDIGVPDLPEAGPVQARIEGTLAGGRLRLDGEVGGIGDSPLQLAGDLPMRLGGPAVLEVPPEAPIEGRIAWRGQVGQIWPFVPLTMHELAGQGALTASVGGSLAAPRLDGRLSLAGGRYESFEAGTVVQDLTLEVALSGDRIVVERLSGTDGAGGRLSGGGEIRLPDGGSGLAGAVEARLESFQVLRRDDVAAGLGGQAQVRLDGARAAVQGRFRTELVEVFIPDRLPVTVAEIEVVDAAAPPPAEPEAQAPPVVADLDVAVELPRRVYVRGRGLDSEWEGNLSVGGTSAVPDYRGELTLVRGTLSLLGKDFRLQDGRILLPGGPSPDPLIAVTAVHQAEDLEVVVKVEGPATAPDFTLTSQPELPQDEILSRMFFGKSATQLSALEAAQLASVIGQLTGITGGGPGLLDRVRSRLGVDVLRVETMPTGEAAVTAGTYLREGVLVGVRQGVGAGSGAVSVEVELTDNISLESEVRQSGATDMGIKFKWDY